MIQYFLFYNFRRIQWFLFFCWYVFVISPVFTDTCNIIYLSNIVLFCWYLECHSCVHIMCITCTCLYFCWYLECHSPPHVVAMHYLYLFVFYVNFLLFPSNLIKCFTQRVHFFLLLLRFNNLSELNKYKCLSIM